MPKCRSPRKRFGRARFGLGLRQSLRLRHRRRAARSRELRRRDRGGNAGRRQRGPGQRDRNAGGNRRAVAGQSEARLAERFQDRLQRIRQLQLARPEWTDRPSSVGEGGSGSSDRGSQRDPSHHVHAPERPTVVGATRPVESDGVRLGCYSGLSRLRPAGAHRAWGYHERDDVVRKARNTTSRPSAKLATTSQPTSTSVAASRRTVLQRISAPLLDLVADAIRNPAFPPNYVQLVRSQSLASISQRTRDPSYRSQRAFQQLLLPPNDPALREDSAASVQAITVDDMKRYAARYFRPDLTRIVVVGDIQPDDVRKPDRGCLRRLEQRRSPSGSRPEADPASQGRERDDRHGS